jgi:hypothetical protein
MGAELGALDACVSTDEAWLRRMVQVDGLGEVIVQLQLVKR